MLCLLHRPIYFSSYRPVPPILANFLQLHHPLRLPQLDSYLGNMTYRMQLLVESLGTDLSCNLGEEFHHYGDHSHNTAFAKFKKNFYFNLPKNFLSARSSIADLGLAFWSSSCSSSCWDLDLIFSKSDKFWSMLTSLSSNHFKHV